MTHSVVSAVRVVVGETNPLVGAGIQSTLYGMGIGHIHGCRDHTGLVDKLNDDMVDLLIWDLALPADLCGIVEQIRQSALGWNPFMAIVATVADAAPLTMRRLINAGVDGVLRKPMPMQAVIDQIGQILQERRPFVATETYLGPSRRGGVRHDDSPDQLIRAPNTLRSKLLDNADERRVQRLIGDGIMRVRELKAQSGALTIARAIDRVAAFHAGRGTEAGLRCDLDRIAGFCQDLARRHRGTSRDHMAAVAASVLMLAECMAADPWARQPTCVKLMAQLGHVMRRTATIEDDSVQLIREIAHTVGRFARIGMGRPG